MRKLLSANFTRLCKNKVFWFTAAITLGFALVNILNSVRSAQGMLDAGYYVTLDDYFFNSTPMLGLYFAAFISLFLGTEYSDGTIRNKLAVGHRRADVFLANFITCFAACILMHAVSWIGSFPGVFLIGEMEMGIVGIIVYAVIAVGFTATFAAVFTVIGSLSSNKAMTVIYTLITFFALLLAASAIYDRLCVPEMSSGAMLTVNGIEMLPAEPNPLYVSGTMRTVLECILDFLPTGQVILMADTAIEHPVRQMIFSVIFTIVTLVGGYFAFRKKDIK